MVAWELDLRTNTINLLQNSMELLGVGSRPPSAFLSRIPADDRPDRDSFVHRVSAQGSETIEFRHQLPNGDTLWLGCRAEGADPDRIVGVAFDITDRKTADDEIRRAANHDALTGLPNRSLFQRRLDQALAQARNAAPAFRRSILRQVTADIHHWMGLDPGCVAFSLPLVEFSNPELANEILSALDLMQIPTRHFEVEVTETVLLGRGSDHVPAILKRFHENGVVIALDDFGTGFSSLTHLKQFPLGHVKVDQSFVWDLERDTGDKAIVSAVIGLGQSLGFEVTAEGVETVRMPKDTSLQSRWMAHRCPHFSQAGSHPPRLEADPPPWSFAD